MAKHKHKQELNKSLAQLHTFAMPATAERWFQLSHVDQIAELEANPDFVWQNTHVLAGGSNSIFLNNMKSILQVNLKGRSIEKIEGSQYLVTAAAGEQWDDFVAWTLAERCYGLENLSLIPGTVGAAPIQNIGAYGVEVSDCLDSIQVYDYRRPEKGVFWLKAEACDFDYRDSQFKKSWSHYLIVQVRFLLSEKLSPVLDYAGLRDLMVASPTAFQIRQRVIQLRQSKLPDPSIVPNAGSFFKNPIIELSQLASLRQVYADIPAYQIADTVKIPAAWLLDTLGYKGHWHGCFGCYEKQPLVLVHDQTQAGLLEEKAAQFKEFVSEIRDQVQNKFQIRLEIEPQLLPYDATVWASI